VVPRENYFSCADNDVQRHELGPAHGAGKARRRTVSPIRQKIALLISNTNFDDPRFDRFQQLSASIARFFLLAAWRHPRFSKKAVTTRHESLHEQTWDQSIGARPMTAIWS
jgi:hypothetical protein